MSNRISEKDLEHIVESLNVATNSPKSTYTKGKDGTSKANVNNYHLSYAYGGVSLHRNVKGGGTTDVLSSGHTTKRELYTMMRAFLAGIQETKGE